MSKRDKKGQFLTREIDFTPNYWLGYLCGLVIGDGSLSETKNRNHFIQVESTKQELITLFKQVSKKAFPQLPIYSYSCLKSREFPNGQTRQDTSFIARVDSKKVYEPLRPFKTKDYQWTIPTFLTTKQSLRGFLRGIFDAEGSVSFYRVTISSKHIQGLVSVAWLLLRYRIFTHIYKYPKCSALYIYDYESRRRFAKYVSFGLLRKRRILNEAIKSQKSRH